MTNEPFIQGMIPYFYSTTNVANVQYTQGIALSAIWCRYPVLFNYTMHYDCVYFICSPVLYFCNDIIKYLPSACYQTITYIWRHLCSIRFTSYYIGLRLLNFKPIFIYLLHGKAVLLGSFAQLSNIMLTYVSNYSQPTRSIVNRHMILWMLGRKSGYLFVM